ncbi:GumC family protein [Aequorivita capsosiphonis]|uniref:GumC family protein n=1 Tax=Aequorivita capsosiphonis TaxID=487317 RepID=UPI00040C4F51|nr:tyrosine-protein kinase family protein [Aequorivita capsosiphonis]
MEIDSENDQIDIKGIIYRYLPYWPWMLLSIVIALLGAFFYLRYTPNSYNTTAKVKVLTDKEATDFALDLDKMLGKSNVNLENESAVFRSFRINHQVVEKLNLQVSYFQTGRVSENQVYTAPFRAVYAPEVDTLKTDLEFGVTITSRGYKLRDMEAGNSLDVPNYYFDAATPQFPFTLEPREAGNIKPGENPEYVIRIVDESRATQSLVNNIKVSPDGKDSDILILSLDATNGEHAQTIINTLIDVYTEDGIKDRQEVSKRTIAFIDERFQYLTSELDSIELAKGTYKQSNNLSIFEADAESIIAKRTLKDEQLFEVETQLLLADVLEKSITTADDFNLLPANIGLNSGAVNNLVADYNEAVLEYNKWKASAGDNNPKVKILKQTIGDLNSNISSSLTGYKNQLKQSLEQNQRAQDQAQSSFSSLPNKEKILRSIERQQQLKENLYLLLLQKREEAAIKVATTAANVKVIDYGITNSIPVAPKRKIIFLGAFLIGILIPVGILYLKFATNNKIYTSKDIEEINAEAPVLGEIPEIANKKNDGGRGAINSQGEEAFRTLGHHLNFMITSSNPTDDGQVIAVTSSVKGEGKTTVSYYVAQTYFQLKKSVLLVGADLRNPQLHPYVNETKEKAGLSNYLNDPDSNLEDYILNVSNGSNRFDLLLSGTIPPMPSVLLSSERFKDFLKEAKKHYDYVIIDTAPTLLVSDTLTFMSQVDFTLYVVRSGVTEKQLISYSKKLVDDKKIAQMGYVINDIDFKGSYGYGYNYGYGYGYHADMDKRPWYQFWG